MTVDVARRPRRRPSSASAAPEPTIAPPASIAIGELEQTIFACPSCSRPLALGAGRCPGCGTRLVRGVQLGKASMFIALGLTVGLLAGAGGGLAFGLLHPLAPAPAAPVAAPNGAAGPNGTPGGFSGAATTTAPSATATAAPTATPAPTATEPSGMPASTRSALLQAIGLNDRLTGDGAGLRAALSTSSFDASTVAQILRSISADSLFGQQLAQRVSAWPGSSDVGAQLASFYGGIHEAAANGLLSSVQNQGAYRAAASQMIRLLEGAAAIDAAVRSAAGSAGVGLDSPSGAPAAP